MAIMIIITVTICNDIDFKVTSHHFPVISEYMLNLCVNILLQGTSLRYTENIISQFLNQMQ